MMCDDYDFGDSPERNTSAHSTFRWKGYDGPISDDVEKAFDAAVNLIAKLAVQEMVRRAGDELWAGDIEMVVAAIEERMDR